MGIGKNPALQRSQIQQAQSAGVWIHVWRDAPHRGMPTPSCRFPLFCVYATHPTRTGVTKAVSAPLPEVPRARQHPTACGETVNSIEISRRPIIHIRRQSGSPSQVVQNWFPKHPPPERRWVTLRLKVVLRLKPPEAVRLTAGSRLGGRCDLESLPILIPFLALDISLDRFFVDRAHRRTKIPARPQMLTPIPLPQLSKLVL